MERIKIKYLRDIVRLEKISVGDWIDLRSGVNLTLMKDEEVLVPLGIAMKLPDGYEAIIAPRSSTAKNFGIACLNSIGIIDNSYCGDNDEWMFSVKVLRDTQINVNDRICQFRIQKKQPEIEFEVVDTLGYNDRGGFGSTGVS